MRKAILGYFFQSLIISCILAITYFVFYTYGFPHLYAGSMFMLIGILFAVNVLFHSYLINTLINNNQAFVRRFLASTMLKLMVYLVIILIMIFAGTPQIKIVLVGFLIFYIVYTAHEIYTLMEFLKKNGSQHVKSK